MKEGSISRMVSLCCQGGGRSECTAMKEQPRRKHGHAKDASASALRGLQGLNRSVLGNDKVVPGPSMDVDQWVDLKLKAICVEYKPQLSR